MFLFGRIDQASCICEFSNGGRGKNGIMCNYYGDFENFFSCLDDEFCTGPTIKERAVENNVARSLLCSGKLLVC